MTMIVVTHEMGFAKRAANRVIYMHTGKVWETGDAGILSNPQTPELKEFMAAEL
jgi:polar amino acid transport system ATP-binding protein